MIRIPFRIPVTIHPLFWLTALIIGFFNSGGNVSGMLLWLGVIFISVLVHEFGHATAALLFGLNPSIELVALGGVTIYPSNQLSLWRQFVIVLNGPIFGFLLFGLSWALLKLQVSEIVHQLLGLFFWVNLIWTALNLVPVMPLDGGQLLRIAFEAFFGAKGLKYSLIIGITVAIVLSISFFFLQSFLIGALFFLFAFQSFDLYRQTRRLSSEDRSDYFQKAFEEAESNLQAGNKEKALTEFERIRAETHEGMIRRLATEYLAFLKYEKGESQQAYQLLQSIRSDLSGEALCLLHKAAFAQKDYTLVIEIGGNCFQVMPIKEVALRNAFSCAALAQEKPAIGWLEAAFQEGLDNISIVLQEPYFDPIRNTDLFKQFQKMHA